MEGAVEGQEAQLRGRCEAAEVGVGPVFGGWAAEAGEAAKDAVAQWQYTPFLLNGQPMRKQTRITISFVAPQ